MAVGYVRDFISSFGLSSTDIEWLLSMWISVVISTIPVGVSILMIDIIWLGGTLLLFSFIGMLIITIILILLYLRTRTDDIDVQAVE